MAEKFVILGGRPLNGILEISGSKNAAGPILAASLLTNEDVIIDNIPLIVDILNIIDVLKEMGAQIEWIGERKIKINTTNVKLENLNFEKISQTRVSVLLIGALIGRFREFKFSRPGGDRIGVRPITTHLDALRQLGVEISSEGNFYYFRRDKLKGREIVLKEFSVTATENLMMAASLAEGETKIIGAAAEPYIQDLGIFLEAMGVKIRGLGTHIIFIEGTNNLKGASHKIIPDPIEVGTFAIAACVTPGQVEIKNVYPDHLAVFFDKLKEIGVNLKKNSNSLLVDYSPDLKGVKVQALPWPGFPTDLLPLVSVLLTQAKGKSLIHDPLYENRFGHLQELKKMGADIELLDPHRALIFGKTPLKGLRIESWDIRAGASLIIAGLIAEGETVLENIFQIDRGYEKIEEKLQKLGADIKRVQ